MKLGATLGAMLILALAAESSAADQIYTDRTAFLTALGGLGLAATTDDYSSYALGNLSNGQTLGAFTYSFDSTTTQPGVASDGSGGQALGDTSLGTDPNTGSGVFVGDESVSLTYTGPGKLQGFGADYSYAPNFEDLPAGLYQLALLDGALTSVANSAGLSANGGSFFLGVIGTDTTLFSEVGLSSTSFGGSYLTPAYQIADVVYAGAKPASVPEPDSASLALAVLLIFAMLQCGRIPSRRRSS